MRKERRRTVGLLCSVFFSAAAAYALQTKSEITVNNPNAPGIIFRTRVYQSVDGSLRRRVAHDSIEGVGSHTIKFVGRFFKTGDNILAITTARDADTTKVKVQRRNPRGELLFDRRGNPRTKWDYRWVEIARQSAGFRVDPSVGIVIDLPHLTALPSVVESGLIIANSTRSGGTAVVIDSFTVYRAASDGNPNGFVASFQDDILSGNQSATVSLDPGSYIVDVFIKNGNSARLAVTIQSGEVFVETVQF